MTSDSGQLHVITVHGTFSGRDNFATDKEADARFFSEKSDFAARLKDGAAVDKWHEFTWSGKNLESGRRKAARRFTRYVKDLPIHDKDRVLILAHSHGGNVALNGLRSAPIDNDISLYTFGTPFIWKESRFFLTALAILIPNIVFFLAIFALALVIGLGYLEYITYGIPFLDPPRTAATAEFYKSFNGAFAIPVAVGITALAGFCLILWPLKKSRYRAKFQYSDPGKFRLRRIWRTDDEAIAMLSADTNIAVPISIFNSFFRFLIAGLFVGIILYGTSQAYRQFQHFRANVDSSLPWREMLPFGAEQMGLGVSLMLALIVLYFIIQFVFKRPLTWLMSRPVNSLLRKTSMGEDGYIRIDAHHRPDMPRRFVTEYNETTPDIAPALEAVKERSDRFLLEHRTAIMRTLAMGDGYLQDLLHETDMMSSLIHTNYFNEAMASFIARNEMATQKETGKEG